MAVDGGTPAEDMQVCKETNDATNDGTLFCQSTNPIGAGICGPDGEGYCEFDVAVTIPDCGDATCLVYVNTHLDWGLKGVGVDANPCDDGLADRYDKGAEDVDFGGWDALENTETDDGPVAITNCKTFEFQHDDGVETFVATGVQNLNEFKKVKGVMGTGTHSFSGDAVEFDTPVELIRDSTGEIVDFGLTDQDGYYALPYKHTGPQELYTVHLLGEYSMSRQFWLKANGTASVDFDPDTGTTSCDTTAQNGCSEEVVDPPPGGGARRLQTERDNGPEGIGEEQPAQSELN